MGTLPRTSCSASAMRSPVPVAGNLAGRICGWDGEAVARAVMEGSGAVCLWNDLSVRFRPTRADEPRVTLRDVRANRTVTTWNPRGWLDFRQRRRRPSALRSGFRDSARDEPHPAPPFPPGRRAVRHRVAAACRRHRGQPPRPLRGKNVALLTPSPDTPAALSLVRATEALGARVVIVQLGSLPPADTPAFRKPWPCSGASTTAC